MQFNTVYELKWYVTFDEDAASKLKLYCKYSSYCLTFQLLFKCVWECVYHDKQLAINYFSNK